jgi:hypothetical protein
MGNVQGYIGDIGPLNRREDWSNEKVSAVFTRVIEDGNDEICLTIIHASAPNTSLSYCPEIVLTFKTPKNSKDKINFVLHSATGSVSEIVFLSDIVPYQWATFKKE